METELYDQETIHNIGEGKYNLWKRKMGEKKIMIENVIDEGMPEVLNMKITMYVEQEETVIGYVLPKTSEIKPS